MKNLLFISSYPFPPSKGSNLHAFYFLKALSAQFSVHCMFFIQPGHDLPRNIDTPMRGMDIESHVICRFMPPKKKGRIFGTLRRLGAFPGIYMDQAVTPENLELMGMLIRRHAIDIVHIEHFHYAKYALRIHPPVKKVIVYHDLHHTIYRQRAHLERKVIQKNLLMIDAWKFYLFQKRLDTFVDAKIFLNADEMAALPKKAEHIPHIVNQGIVCRKPRQTDIVNLFFIGACKHPPNMASIEFIIEKVLPLLVKRTDRFKFNLIGSGTEQFETLVNRDSTGRFVTIHGFVSDINEALKEMDIALFPIVYGGGIKTKIIDAMAAGIPVVTTPSGLSGLERLPDDCIGIGNTAAEIVEQVLGLMHDYSERLSRSRMGINYVQKYYSFDSFSARIKSVYNNL